MSEIIKLNDKFFKEDIEEVEQIKEDLIVMIFSYYGLWGYNS